MTTTTTNPKDLIDWGYDAPANNTTPLDEFVVFITDPKVKPAEKGKIKNVLIYWDRGDRERGDEEKMLDMGINS